MTFDRIETEKAPKAIGPYSQAIKSNSLVFCSGQIAINPETNEFKPGTIEEQTETVCKNLAAVLEAAGSSLEKVVKTTVFLADISDFPKMNAVYAQFFSGKPARATVAVKALPKGALVEIDAIAEVKP